MRLVGWGSGAYFRRVCEAVPIRPAYLVDSDASRWGTRVLGCRVRPPEALRAEDPTRTQVVIYSQAAREIAARVRELGDFPCATPFELEAFTRFGEPGPEGAGPNPWLAEAIDGIAIDRPVVVLGKGPGLGRVPRGIAATHFTISVNQALAAVERADLVVAMDLHNLVQLLFDPRLAARWERLLVPDGLTNRWDCLDTRGLPFGERDFRAARTVVRRGWNATRVPLEEVDRVIDLARFGRRLVRFRLLDTGHTGDPVDARAWDSPPAGGSALQHHTNSAHFLLHLLWRKGVRQILTAGLGAEDGYHRFDFGIEHAYDHAYILRRWETTREILARLGIRYRRLEEMSERELASLAAPAGIPAAARGAGAAAS
jgi:hypothetical protein